MCTSSGTTLGFSTSVAAGEQIPPIDRFSEPLSWQANERLVIEARAQAIGPRSARSLVDCCTYDHPGDAGCHHEKSPPVPSRTKRPLLGRDKKRAPAYQSTGAEQETGDQHAKNVDEFHVEKAEWIN